MRLFRPILFLDCYFASGVRRVLRQIGETFLLVFDMLNLLLFYILIWAVVAYVFSF